MFRFLCRRTLLSYAAMLGLAVTLSTGPAAADADVEKAKAQVQALADQALKLLANDSVAKDDRHSRFRELFNSNFSTLAIGRFVLGPHWRTASEDQRARFLDVFEDYVVRSYTIQLLEYAGEEFDVLSASPDGSSGALVRSHVQPKQGEPIKLDWILRETKEGMRIVDVRVENISMAITQRDDFKSIIRQRGNNLDGLIDALGEKLAALRQQAEGLMK